MLLEEAQNEYLQWKRQISSLETEIKAVKDTFKDAAKYVEILEKEVERVNQ
jgi:archaellum component FlaC